MDVLFLSDPKAEVIRRYDLLQPDGGQTGGISRPADFLIDLSGTVRWRDLTESYWSAPDRRRCSGCSMSSPRATAERSPR
jgi:hypothetical protein